MAFVTGNPFKTESAKLSLGVDNYESLISSSELAPTSSTSTFKVIDGNHRTITGKSTWMLNITFAQDWLTAASLSNYLWENEGEVVPFTVEPLDGGPSFTGDVTLVAPSVGGAADADATSTVALGCQGKPTLVPAP